MNVDWRHNKRLLYVNFNQDLSHITVGTRQNFQIYRCTPFEKCYQSDYGGCKIVEMYYSTSLLVLVGSGDQPRLSPRTLLLWDTADGSQQAVRQIEFSETILSVRLSKSRLIVVCEKSAYVCSFPELQQLSRLETCSNPAGVLAVSNNPDKPYVAIPGRNHGEVILFNFNQLTEVAVINAHRNPITSLCFDASGSFLASVSDRGTIIRTFSIPQGTRIKTFRRGSSPTTIYSLAFSGNADFLAVSSESSTLHIYKLAQPSTSQRSREWMAEMLPPTIVSATSYLAYYLPESITEYLDNVWDYASAQLPQAGIPNICAMQSHKGRIYVATAEGILNVYRFNEEESGECVLQTQHLLLQEGSEQVAARYLRD
eukprot:TRINITY_DN9329_c0_g1_i2.p1 TRINITY_DN9329_c0_g1~~TRINITY_DN9329_c0_g1_i2.p1  ORF type:complete len:370 (-),score=53.25 TRINITY_DN9329_c0_g1_i2:281-1390(-)